MTAAQSAEVDRLADDAAHALAAWHAARAARGEAWHAAEAATRAEVLAAQDYAAAVAAYDAAKGWRS